MIKADKSTLLRALKYALVCWLFAALLTVIGEFLFYSGPQDDRAADIAPNLLINTLLTGVIFMLFLRWARLKSEGDKAADRFAAFPVSNPNPVIECSLTGDVLWSNPATREICANLKLTPADLLPPRT